MKDRTRATVAGRRPSAQHGAISTPVTHASTILQPNLAAWRASRKVRYGDGVTYGVHGTPGTYALEEAIAALEGGHRTRLCQSGLAAVTGALLAYLSAGDHLLMVDSCYEPTRRFCDGMLRRLGVETTYYDPLIDPEGLEELLQPNTRVLFLESPGSLTFEVQDVPALAAVANDIGVWCLLDNTWASPLFFKPFEHGVDVSIQAVTKYISGHGDLVLGSVTANKAAYPRLQKCWGELGHSVGPDDAYLALRGFRTIGVRMAHHEAAGIQVADWLEGQPEVLEVMHPGRPGDPGHALWRRDFLGASGLFGFVLAAEAATDAKLAALVDNLDLFGLGASWAGFMSLMIPADPRSNRAATPWPRPGRPNGQAMRVSIGLEDPGDLIDDLRAGFERLRNA
ncbi:MAG: cystathionine beta-lyase [Pseudomonadota bacterium]